MRARLAADSGYAVPLALAVIAIVAGFGAVTIALATHNVDRSSRDRDSVRALAAADAGLDAAAYRMSKALLASRIDGLLDPATQEAVRAEAGCLNLSVGGTLQATVVDGGSCVATSPEDLDATVAEDGLGASANFRYWIKLRANVLLDGRSLVERQIVAVGEVDGVVRRLAGVYRFDLEAPVGSVVTRSSYVECTAEVPEPGADPATGCPGV